MAEPNRVYDDDQSEKAVNKPDLRALEGVSGTPEPDAEQADNTDGDDVSANKSVSPESLKQAEEEGGDSAAQTAADEDDFGYREESSRFGRKNGSSRGGISRNQAIGG